MSYDGNSRCSRKASLAIFFTVEVVAFTLCLVSVLSPTWQWVGLERGRTEHHHGLWLDCKRDYSYDYGRDREYYETLFRRELQGSPFALFIYPHLECVYKFDYYIDPEDLYDHNHDENRLWDDAYQHLFLGHKIAALAACGVAVLLAGASLLLGICSFCHRTFIAAATSLVALSSILAFAGVAVFYGWAANQDNAMIKQRDEQETYEQNFGWGFYFQLVGACLHLFASTLGCFATSVAFSKGRAKLVRIDVVESSGGPSASSHDLLASSNQLNDTQPFKRSFSAIYRVDSTSLQQWEKEYSKRVNQSQDFVRTKSMPMIGKKQRKSFRKRSRDAQRASLHRSSSNMFLSSGNETGETTTGTTNTMESTTSERARRPPSIPTPQPPKLKSALKTPQSDRRFASTYALNKAAAAGGGDSGNEPGLDSTYEYLPIDGSAAPISGVTTFIGGRRERAPYDEVYESEPADLYLEPNSRVEARASTSTLNNVGKALPPGLPLAGSIHSIPAASTQKETVIDDVARPSSMLEATRTSYDTRNIELETRSRIRELQTIEELQRIEMMRRPRPQPPAKPPFVPPKPSLAPPTTTFEVTSATSLSSAGTDKPPRCPPTPDPKKKPTLGVKDLAFKPSTSNGYCTESRDAENSPPRELCLNTFGSGDMRGSVRSLTSLKLRPGYDGCGSGVAAVFERPDSSVEPSIPSPSSSNSTRDPPKPMTLHKKLLLGTLPDEVDRSVGSSTLMENETMRDAASPNSYARDAELRLNLFLSDPVISSRQSDSAESSETTV